MPTIPADQLRKFIVDVFLAAGFRAVDADRGADVLMWASRRGVDTHGVRNLKNYYIDCCSVGWRDGVICTDAVFTIDDETKTTATMDARGGLGLSVSVEAMELAIAKASEHGVGMVTVRNSTHFGAAGCYAQMAVDHDMIGFASSGYLFPHGQEKGVVPAGGLLPMLSTNPLAVACPANRLPPFVLDMSTSVVPVNRIEMFQEIGRSIPNGWALDADHHPTTDPAAVAKMLPLGSYHGGGDRAGGGHKGFGLSLAVWVMSGLLSGAWREDAAPDRVLGESTPPVHGFAQEGIGHTFAAVCLDCFGDPARIKRGMDAMIQTLNDSPPAAAVERVVVPGQLEYETEQLRNDAGIPVSQVTWNELQELSRKFEIPLKVDPTR